jgi:Protein kinase domain
MPELPLVGNEFAGYRLRSVLGRGGMSVVYQAENPRLGSLVALKVLAPELCDDDVFRTRFLEESRIAASMNHPNVIPIYDMGASDDLLYIAMRYVAGTDMRQILKKRGRMVPEIAVFLVGQAARALDAAHRKGLVHRDVKPGNLLVERSGDDDPDHVYLADFGITKHAMSRSGLTSTGQFVGTIDYVAPEQIQGTSVSGLADQYSLGCVLYECLTGRVPFEKDLDAAIIWAHVEEMPPMPSTVRPDLPAELDDVFSRVLAKKPENRYRSCREFIDAARVALGEPVTGPFTGRAFGGPTADPGTGGPVGNVALAPEPGRDSGDDAPGPQPGGFPGRATAAAAVRPATEASVVPAARVLRSDTVTSHRQPPPPPSGGTDGDGGGGQGAGGPGKRRSRRPRWLMTLAAIVVAVAAAGGYLAYHGLASHPKKSSHAMAMSSASPKASPKASPSALMAALLTANKSADAAGKLPPSACHSNTSTKVTCTKPMTGVDEVVFQTYPSLTALYQAYVTDAKSINSGQFHQNLNDCTITSTNGEVSWNHQFRHPHNFSVTQMESGKMTDNQAAGRVFCTFYNGAEDMIWTQNDGHLLGWVVGAPHEDVWNWWVAVHHNISLGGSMPMHM